MTSGKQMSLGWSVVFVWVQAVIIMGITVIDFLYEPEMNRKNGLLLLLAVLSLGLAVFQSWRYSRSAK